LIIEVDPIEMITGDFPQRFLDEFLALAGIEFFLPFVFVADTCRMYLDFISLAAVLKCSDSTGFSGNISTY
jgi:hypothetical protein